MADLTRAEELVQAIEGDAAFQSEVEGAPTATAKRQVLDLHGYQDVGLDDMRAHVESKGGQLVVPEGGRELNDDELAAVAGGVWAGEADPVALGVGIAGAAVLTSAAAAAA